MRQITKHDVNKLTASQLKAKLPFQIVSDGEIIAVVLPIYDVNKLGQESEAGHDVNKLNQKREASHDVNKLGELRFSKSRQVRGKLAQS